MRLLAVGNTAEVYELDSGRVCKLFRPGYDGSAVEREFHNAAVVFSMGIRSPRPYAIVQINGRNGIIYDKVTGESLTDRYLRTRDDHWISAFAELHKRLLCLETEEVGSYKSFLKYFAGGSAQIMEKIDRLPDGSRLLHGDYHPNNVLVDGNGDLVLIDFMNVCRGPALYDIARTFFLIGAEGQASYLRMMDCSERDIAPYLEVIGLVRDREIRGDGGQ